MNILPILISRRRIDFFGPVEHMAEIEGVTEQQKVENQMEWVGRMNNIHNRVKEIVNKRIIFNKSEE